MSASKPSARAHLTECLIAVTAILAGSYFLERPQALALVQKRADLASAQGKVGDVADIDGVMTRLESQVAATSESINALKKADAVSGASSRLYDSLNKLANSHGVRIIRLDPTGLRQLSPASIPNAAVIQDQTLANQPLRGEVQGYRMTVHGSYQSVAEFIHACEHDLGTSRIMSFRVSPIPDSTRGEVEADIESNHLRFLATEQSNGSTR